MAMVIRDCLCYPSEHCCTAERCAPCRHRCVAVCPCCKPCCKPCCGCSCVKCGECLMKCCVCTCRVVHRPMGLCLTFTILVTFLPAFCALAFAIKGTSAPCGSPVSLSAWLYVTFVLQLINLAAAAWIFVLFGKPYNVDSQRDRDFVARVHTLLCYKPWMALYMIVYIFQVAWQFVGHHAMSTVNVTVCPKSTVGMANATLVFMWVFLLGGGAIMFISYIFKFVVARCCPGFIRNALYAMCNFFMPSATAMATAAQKQATAPANSSVAKSGTVPVIAAAPPRTMAVPLPQQNIGIVNVPTAQVVGMTSGSILATGSSHAAAMSRGATTLPPSSTSSPSKGASALASAPGASVVIPMAQPPVAPARAVSMVPTTSQAAAATAPQHVHVTTL